MNWYKQAQGEYHYLINCVSAKGEDIQEMVDVSDQISWEEFNRHVSIEEVRNALGDIYDFGEEDRNGIKIQDDYAVSFYRSVYKEQPCYYIYWSAIEFVFVEGYDY